MKDDIVEEIRRIREELIQRHGGIDGYFKHCQEQERQGETRSKPRTRKRPARAAIRKVTKTT
jgi:hypothetical protein